MPEPENESNVPEDNEAEPKQHDGDPALGVTLGRLAKSAATIVFFFLVQWATTFVLQATGQEKASWAVFLHHVTTFFAVWGLIVIAGFEFLTICLEVGASFIVRLLKVILEVRRVK